MGLSKVGRRELMSSIREQSEFVACLNGEDTADVFAWLTSPQFGLIEQEWDA